MGNIVLDERRINTMRQKLGGAARLITDDNYLPMFRNRQNNYEKQFNFSIKLAKKKRKPAAYFAKMWAKKNLEKTLEWLNKLMAQVKARAAEEYQKAKERARLDSERTHYNADGLAKLAAMKREFNLIS